MKRIKLVSALLLTPLFLMARINAPYDKLADKLTNQHIREMNREGYKVVLTGGAMFDDVKEISLWLQLDAAPTLEKARLFYLSATENLLARVNQDKAVRPYLHDYPFTSQNLDYCLKFKIITETDSSEPIPIYRVSSSNGQIDYWVYDPDPMNIHFQKVYYSESYEDALRIAGGSKTLTISTTEPPGQSKNRKMR